MAFLMQNKPQTVASSRRAKKKAQPSVPFNVRLASLEDGLRQRFPLMDAEIRGAILALLSGESQVIVGPPGTAKTLLFQTIAGAIKDAKYFHLCLHPHTEPDELLGPIDIRAYREEGKLTRITEGYLPTANIAFLDEVFRSSAAVRSLLLDVLMYRRIRNGGHFIEVPLVTLFTATNFISFDEEDRAFYDRLLIRVFQNTDETADDLAKVIDAGIEIESTSSVSLPMVTLQEIIDAQSQVRKTLTTISEDTRRKYAEVIVDLRQEKLHVSRRRAIKTLKVAAALMAFYSMDEILAITQAIQFTFPEEATDQAKLAKPLKKLVPQEVKADLEKLQTIHAELDKYIAQMVNFDKLDSKKQIEFLARLKDFLKGLKSEIEKTSDHALVLPIKQKALKKAHELADFLQRQIDDLRVS